MFRKSPSVLRRRCSALTCINQQCWLSALGQELTSASRSGMSALPLKADMLGVGINVCFVPIADVTPTEAFI